MWPKKLPGSKATKPRTVRDAAYWEAEAAAREQKAAEKAEAKAAAKAAREAAEAARPKKPRREKQRTTVPLPANRDEVTDVCVRNFLVNPPAAGTENAAPAWAQPPLMPQRVLPPIPVHISPANE